MGTSNLKIQCFEKTDLNKRTSLHLIVVWQSFSFVSWMAAKLWAFGNFKKHKNEAGRSHILILTRIFVISNACKFWSIFITGLKLWNFPNSDMLFKIKAVIFSVTYLLSCNKDYVSRSKTVESNKKHFLWYNDILRNL